MFNIRHFSPRAAGFLAAAMVVLPMTTFSVAQDAYRRPPEAITRILEAPPTPAVSMDPQRRYMLLIDREILPPIADLARPMLRLGGSRIDPGTHGPHEPRSYVGLLLRDLEGTWEHRIQVPPDASGTADLGSPSWSPDGSRVVFTVTRPEGIELWAVDLDDVPAKAPKARRLTGPMLNATSGAVFRWMPDGERLLCQFVVDGKGPEPVRASAPMGPVVQESRGRAATVRTYQDLLQDPHDEELFDHYFTSQLAYVDVATGKRTNIGRPAIYAMAAPSPDGQYLLVSRVERPYSYLVPWSLFPRTVELWNASGKEPLKVRELVRMPLRDDTPIQGVQTGPRGQTWHALEDATLLWTEALDGGDPRNKVSHRDRIMTLTPPFQGDGEELFKTEHRYSGMSYLADGGVFVSEFDRDRRWSRTWLYDGGNFAAAPRLVWDRSTQDRYGNPGSALTVRMPNGRWAVRVEDNAIYLAGPGATPEGDRPFLDRMSLEDFSTERLWRNEGENYESVVDILEPDASAFLTIYESPDEPANYFVRRTDGETPRQQITFFPDPAPELRQIRRQLVTYTREDGVALSATLYLPADYQEGQRLPLLVWAYPQEYNDPAMAGQVSGSPYRFTRIGGSSHLFLLTQGYAIMDGATMPVIGDPETVNDTFVEQIVASARAAIDKAVEMGVADRDRVAAGGHSYGAFMTANLLAHSDLFRAGLARSGAYNRTLTPFGFQGERRTFWEATDTYINLSPFTHAHRIKAPILLIHGQIDNNAGTFPMQSERLFHAVNGHGGTARLVMLPFEGHGYRARESVMHVLAEMVEWMDRHVKHAESQSSE